MSSACRAAPTWVDQIYLTGRYDPAAQTFTVDETRLPSDADRERLLLSRPMPDFTVPCPPPDGGWPAPTQEWPGDEIAALDGYAGAWIDEAGPVWTVKFTGDLDAAEAAISEHYTDALCVVSASHSAAELSAIVEQLQSLSSVQILSTATYVDASGEWIEAGVIAPDPERQSAFDARVRIRRCAHGSVADTRDDRLTAFVSEEIAPIRSVSGSELLASRPYPSVAVGERGIRHARTVTSRSAARVRGRSCRGADGRARGCDACASRVARQGC